MSVTIQIGGTQPQGQGYYQQGMQNPQMGMQQNQGQMHQNQGGNPFQNQNQNQYQQQQNQQMYSNQMPQNQGMVNQNQGFNQQNNVIAQQQQALIQQNQQILANQQALLANAKVKKDGWQRLAERDGIFIKQRFDWEEMMTGCEQPNTYLVYAMNKEGEQKGNPLFRCTEKSNCCARACLSGECRPFIMGVNIYDKDFTEIDNEPFLRIDRPCKCTCYCLGRPEMTVNCVSNNSETFVGKVIEPCQCCNLVLNVYNKDGAHAYVVDGSCCQLGIWFKCPCDPCQNIDFKIKDAAGNDRSELKKKSPGCLQASISDTDNFSLFFPTGCSKEDKAALLAATLFLDFRHFEEAPKKKSNGGMIVVNNNDA